MANTRIRESTKVGNARVVSYYKPSEYLLINVIRWCLKAIAMPFVWIFKGLWWIIKTPIKLIVNLIKGRIEEHK